MSDEEKKEIYIPDENQLEKLNEICQQYYDNREIDFQIIKTKNDEYDCTISYNAPTKKEAKNVAVFLYELKNGAIEEHIRTALMKIGLKDRQFLSHVLSYYEAIQKKFDKEKSPPIMRPSQTFKHG